MKRFFHCKSCLQNETFEKSIEPLCTVLILQSRGLSILLSLAILVFEKMSVSAEKEAKHALSHFTVLQRFHQVAELSLRIETGRTHQIRVHLSAIGHPVLEIRSTEAESVILKLLDCSKTLFRVVYSMQNLFLLFFRGREGADIHFSTSFGFLEVLSELSE